MTTTTSSGSAQTTQDYYRHDGVRITHDPYAPGMADKYCTPGHTDNDGFDPYADSVGPGIYGGIVELMVVPGTWSLDGSIRITIPIQDRPVYAGAGGIRTLHSHARGRD